MTTNSTSTEPCPAQMDGSLCTTCMVWVRSCGLLGVMPTAHFHWSEMHFISITSLSVLDTGVSKLDHCPPEGCPISRSLARTLYPGSIAPPWRRFDCLLLASIRSCNSLYGLQAFLKNCSLKLWSFWISRTLERGFPRTKSTDSQTNFQRTNSCSTTCMWKVEAVYTFIDCS